MEEIQIVKMQSVDISFNISWYSLDPASKYKFA